MLPPIEGAGMAEEPDIRELMKQALVLSGYSVYSTSSVAEGLNIINAFPVDILVAEVLLADSDEYQQILNIQKSERNLNIILLTSYSNEKVELREIENFRFLQKPIKPSILIKEIQNIERGEALL
jgi:DNA-binding response OmpR family regulator